jgi:tetratricopeptide (TPR) repeat protein
LAALAMLPLANCTGPTVAPTPEDGSPQLLARFDGPRFLKGDAPLEPPTFLLGSLRSDPINPELAKMSAAAVVDAYLLRGLPGRHAVETPTEVATGAESLSGVPGDPMTAADLAAVKSYAGARQAILAGEFADAERLLQEVLSHDPQSAAAWRLVADSSRLQGRPAAFLAACERMLRADPNSVYALTHLGRRYSSLGEDEDACRLLALARRTASNRQERVPTPLIDAALATSLHRLGYLRAATEIYADLLRELRPALQAHPYHRAELRSLFEQQSGFWRRRGDAFMALGEPAAATAAYESAAESSAELPGSFLLARRVWAELAAGKPGSAADLFLRDLVQHPDRTPSRHDAELTRYLARHTKLDRNLAHVLDQFVEQHPGSKRGALIRAGLQPPKKARSALNDLLSSTADVPAWSEAAFFLADSPQAKLALAEDLLQRHPSQARRVWQALRDASDPDASLAAWLVEQTETDPAPGRAVLAALALHDQGRWEETESLLQRAGDSEVAVLGRVQLLIEQRRHTEALALLEDRQEGSAETPASLRLRIKALHAGQRCREARGVSERLRVEAGPLSAQDHLSRARLDADLRQYADQAASLRRSLDIDPQGEAAYGELIRLFDRNGPLSDGREYTKTVQALHSHAPNSPVLRLLRAEEQIRRQEFAAAGETLSSLARECPHDGRVLDTLVDIWSTLRHFESGLETLATMQARHPHEPALARAVARLRVHQGDTDEAIAGLRVFLEAHPQAAELHDLHESAMHQAGRTDEAMQRVVARIGAVAPSRRSPEMSIALAMAHLGRGETETVMEALNHIDHRVTLTEEQCGKVRHLLLGVIRDHQAQAEAGEGLQVRDLEAAVAHRLDGSALWLKPEIHEAALALAWFRLVTLLDGDDADGALELLDRYQAQQRLREILAAVNEALAEAPFEEIAYFISNWPGLSPASQEVILGRVLEINPNHAMALNNLGYTWLEQGGRLEEAVDYLERAYAAAPDDHNIIDSLGWARYKQGLLMDETAADGSMQRRGAVSLLEEALSLVPDFAEPVVMDHLADSLWQVKRYDEARAHWQRALELLEGQEAADWQQTLREQLQGKLTALERGEEPPVAASPDPDEARN